MSDTQTPETDYSTQQLYGKKYVPARVARSMERERNKLRAALQRIADCDWVITLPNRMDAVRKIARDALEGVK